MGSDAIRADGSSDSPEWLDVPTSGAVPERDSDRIPSTAGTSKHGMIGRTIGGRYRIVGVLGEGGFGTVFRAEQVEPVQREVALKLVRAGVASAEIVRRFEAERQVLAMMTHPGIARVLDGGLTDDGRPFFVMELVAGVPITRYADDHRLSIDERIALVIDVCRAVHHAHQRGVIHRDLKPSNLLVAEVDGQPVCKVIDFGVAKAEQDVLEPGATQTLAGVVVGTPQYMSPEQVAGDPTQIDTRSDVYALGVLLHELLVGRLPFEHDSTKSPALDEVLRAIREEEPRRPSSSLTRLDDERREAIPRRRNSDVQKLVRRLRGDLDWISMRALEKDPARRYESAAALARDLERHQRDEPVDAGPPDLAYRARKFVKRHRVAVAAAGLVSTALVLGSIGAIVGLVQANSAKNAALAAGHEAHLAREAEIAARADAERKAAELDDVVTFQSSILESIDALPTGVTMLSRLRERVAAALPEDTTETRRTEVLHEFDRMTAGVNPADLARGVIEDRILSPAIAESRRRFTDRPRIRAAIGGTIVDSRIALGLEDEALELAREVVEDWRLVEGDYSARTLDAERAVALLLRERSRFVEALAIYERVLAAFLDLYGPAGFETQIARIDVATTLRGLGRLDEALETARAALAATEALSETPQIVDLRASARSQVARSLRASGAYDEALEEAIETVRVCRQAREMEPTPERVAKEATASETVGAILFELGRYDDAADRFERVYEQRVRLLGSEHPDSIATLVRIGSALGERGDRERAAALFERAVQASESIFGADRPETISPLLGLSTICLEAGDWRRARTFTLRAHGRAMRLLQEGDPLRSAAISNLGMLQLGEGRFDEAVSTFRELLAIQERRLGDRHPESLTTLGMLADTLERTGQRDDAVEYWVRASDGHVAVLGPDHPRTLITAARAAAALNGAGRTSDAVDLLLPIVTDANAGRLKDDDTLLIVRGRGATYANRADRVDDALFFLEGNIAALERRGEGAGPRAMSDRIARATTLSRGGDAARAVAELERLLATAIAPEPGRDPGGQFGQPFAFASMMIAGLEALARDYAVLDSDTASERFEPWLERWIAIAIPSIEQGTTPTARVLVALERWGRESPTFDLFTSARLSVAEALVRRERSDPAATEALADVLRDAGREDEARERMAEAIEQSTELEARRARERRLASWVGEDSIDGD